ncbi:SAM-dependent methyltransferase [Micromonospora sp. NPDC047707]|uniref:SAM-dependent methyltransferase n=1 Tax=Micromonospora sp. NPDC047707 TaxID=3154498 RepID=UPI003455EA7C
MSIRWRDAMDRALYGPGGFFVAGSGPADHFRTSVHASPAFASALLRLINQVDAALGHPPVLDVVDVGAGRGELVRSLAASVTAGVSAPAPLAQRVRFTAVELAPRPADLPTRIRWVDEMPAGITGVLLATEWLDNIPLDLAVPASDGWRYLLVDPTTGEETLGDPVRPEDANWLTTWWPLRTPAPLIKTFSASSDLGSDENLLINGVGGRAEIGRSRDEAWGRVLRHVDRGLAVAVDYGHLRDGRPVDGTLTGYRGGRQVRPVPDGSCDVTAHVAMDSVASTGERVARCAYSLVSQREALRALGADGARPALSLAVGDPAGYVRALAAASAVAELTDPAGLGGHWWLLQPVGVTLDPFVAR